MKKDWESKFNYWSKGPSNTEQEKAENAVRMIRKAIEASDNLKERKIIVFAQGSYRNRVNVKQDSDVDVGVLCLDTFFPHYSNESVKELVIKRLSPATYLYEIFKNELENALVHKFGRHSVVRGDKAFDIKANSYRVEADVAAFFEHRLFYTDKDYYSGVEMRPDTTSNKNIVNWPEFHYKMGVMKNENTKKQFKKVVRILKSLSNEMATNDYVTAKNIPSFLIECLVFNVQDGCFKGESYSAIVREVLIDLIVGTSSIDKCYKWQEVSMMKSLFNDEQPWKRSEVQMFVRDAWEYLGF
jgi:predicted nucleotidyltransferase